MKTLKKKWVPEFLIFKRRIIITCIYLKYITSKNKALGKINTKY